MAKIAIFRAFFLAFPLSCLAFSAGAAPLPVEIKEAVVELRRDCPGRRNEQGVSARMGEVKRTLREWAESRLTELTADGSPEDLERQLRAEILALDIAALVDGACVAKDGPGDDEIGMVGLSLARDRDLLILRTAVGTDCGSDQSAYLYRRRAGGWQLFWQNQQDDYRRGHFSPRYFVQLLTAPAEAGNADRRLVLDLVFHHGCFSTWQTLGTQIWRTGATPEAAKLLFREYAEANIDPPPGARLELGQAYVEYVVLSGVTPADRRHALRRYRIDGEKVTRIDPIALSPMQFIEEWIAAPWAQSARWIEGPARATLRRWHALLQNPQDEGHLGKSLRCRRNPNLWQVELSYSEEEKHRPLYFLLRWRPNYTFRLSGIATSPRRDCDLDADPAGYRRRMLIGDENGYDAPEEPAPR